MINLGDKVRDRITGFEGIAICRHSYMTGCDRITVQPPAGKDGKLPEGHSFDETTLEAIEPAKSAPPVEPENQRGGPERYPDRRLW